jgi:hypothetical protein
MELRHSAALVLAGFFLVIPPTFKPPASPNPPPLDVDFGAPAGKWTIAGQYNTMEACKTAVSDSVNSLMKGNFQLDLPDNMSPDNVKASEQNMLAAYTMGQCVSSDDPVFKGRKPQ